MPGTKTGGLKARDKNLANDPDFYKKIGAKGGKKGTTGGFAYDPQKASIAGAKGGAISRRGYKYIRTEDGYRIYSDAFTGEIVTFKILDK